MKKSKIIVPALGIILLTTAASVTGTVAWFTANTVYTATMGEFAVVNTKNNLSCTLGNGVGTAADNENNKIDVSSGYKLTDASVDHTDAGVPIIAPDEAGTKVGTKTNLASYVGDSRATNVHSAFTWTMTFKMSFSGTADKKMGLFIDLSKSWTHEVVNITAADISTAGGSISKTGYYTDAACSEAVAADITAAGKYYRQAPDTTGKGFRIAIVPTNIPSGSYGVTKVWAPNQTTAKSNFVDGLAVDAALAGTAYSGATTVNSGAGTTLSTGSAAAGKVLMSSDTHDSLPDADAVASSGALSGYNCYLGYFGPVANASVSLTYTCIAWYEGTDENIVNTDSTVYEVVTSCMEFDVVQLTD